MKIISFYFVFLIAAFLFAGCKDNIIGVKDVSLNQEFELGIKQTAHIKDTDLLITFVKVTEDSRCPENAFCLWQGNGEIELKINAHKQEQRDSLNTFLDPKELYFYEYKIELKELIPYPVIDQEINPDKYSIKLKVSLLEFGAAPF